MFNTCLPHQRALEKWCKSVEVKPGFTEYSFDALRSKVSAAREEGKCLKAALIVDEMAVRQQVEWDGYKYHGFVDFGTDLDDDTLPVAKVALTFMVVAVNEH